MSANPDLALARRVLAGIVLGFLCVGGLFAFAIWGPPDSTPSRSARPAPDIGLIEKQRIAGCEALIQKSIADGAIHSVDAKAHRMRMSPALWRLLPLEKKQGLVTFYSTYFRCKDGLNHAYVLSDRNDTVLGRYDTGNGMQILE